MGSPEDYSAFLNVQYAARAPIERWATAHLPPDVCPPMSATLIAQDLAEMGALLPREVDFAFPERGDPLGLAWAMGGSSLGNKALLARRRRAGLAGADRFLGDSATATYFRRLLPRFEVPVSPAEEDAAVAAATAVFTTFLSAVGFAGLRAAA